MKYRQIVSSVFLFLLVSFALHAQVTGRITGTVTDASGAAVPGATVNLTLPGGTTPVLTTTTTGEGLFNIPSVRPDYYDLTVESAGFNKAVMTRIKVDSAKELSLPPIQLEVAAAVQTVEVTDSTTAVQTTSVEIAQTVTQEQVEKLPVLDRQVSNLYLTQAGVVNSRTSTTINGLRPSYSNVMLDGVNIQDSVRTNALDYMPNKLTIGQIKEFTLASSNANPTIGGNATTVALTTPSGTNNFHGNAYWYNRNSYFAANEWFNNKNGVEKPFLNLNQLGGSIGGPILKDKLLFYTNYEAYRLRQQQLNTMTILTPEARQGIFRYRTSAGIQSFNLMQAASLGIDPFMQGQLQQMPAAGNSSDVGDGLNTTGYSFNARSNNTRDNVTGKVDYYLNAQNAFSGSFIWNRDIVDRPDLGSFYSVVPPISNDNKANFLSAGWRWNPAPTLTNELRGGFNRTNGAFVRSTDLPNFFVTTPLVGAAEFIDLPLNTEVPESRDVNNYSIQDNATWVKGAHTFSFGFQANLFRTNSIGYFGTVPSYGLGLSASNSYGFVQGDIPGASATDIGVANNLLTTLGGLISTSTQQFNVTSRTSGFVPGAPSRQQINMNNYAPYFSDTWKLRRNLTLVLGLRWEYFSPVDEKNALMIQPYSQSGNPIEALLGNARLDFAGSAVGRPLYKRDLNNFAPNIGFAWDVFGNGRTAVRGGYSIAYANDNNINSIYNVSRANNGLFSTMSAANLNATISGGLPPIQVPQFQVPTTAKEQFELTPNSPPVMGLIANDLATPYVQQWNFGVEQAWKGFTFEGRYVGNRVLKQFRQIDFNQIDVRRNGFLTDFINARQNGFLALEQRGIFDPRYNTAVNGSQPLPFLDTLYGKGQLNAGAFSGPIRRGEAGSLAQLYQMYGYLPDGVSLFPSPYVLYSSYLGNSGESKYHAAQFEVRKRMANGIQLQGNYVFSKVLSNTYQFRGLDEQIDNANPGIEWARAQFDLQHAFKLNHYVPLPFGPGRKWNPSNSLLSRIAGGWAFSGFLVVQSGPPVSILSARGTLNRGARSSQNTVDTPLTLPELDKMSGLFVTGNGPYFIDPKHIGPDGRGVAPDGAAPFSGQVFFNPQAGGLGSLQRRILSGPWFNNYDFALIKETRITETQMVEFRADFYNLLNHPNFFVGDQNVNSANFGKITSMLNTGNGVQSRVMQFGLYYRF